MRIRVYSGAEAALGLGRAELLAGIGQTQSIAQTARDMGMSYMKAWKLVQSMNGCFREALVEVKRGGRVGGTARLTGSGQRALELYRQMERESLVAVEPFLEALGDLMG